MGAPCRRKFCAPLLRSIQRPLPSSCKLPFFLATFFARHFFLAPLAHFWSPPYNFFVRPLSLSRGYYIPSIILFVRQLCLSQNFLYLQWFFPVGRHLPKTAPPCSAGFAGPIVTPLVGLNNLRRTKIGLLASSMFYQKDNLLKSLGWTYSMNTCIVHSCIQWLHSTERHIY